ncbi:hypothetical protein [Pedobacter hiemivivus]|uniref:Uncharacterized protein n=1 Tax=Pedobacter hiemivivus TaxID=2530454 RepID=A0A4R0M986_9SPHI|nr:hypothetical protein [Pedobacter hiemivivus]TCC82691.1 hypothetical protein EZ444_26465 [Pedobacter hiemivivus]
MILYEYDPVAGDITELTVFQDFRRNKLHPRSVLLPIRKNNEDITYLVGLKNVEANQFITDVNGTDLIRLWLNPGKEQITTILDEKWIMGTEPLAICLLLKLPTCRFCKSLLDQEAVPSFWGWYSLFLMDLFKWDTCI